MSPSRASRAITQRTTRKQLRSRRIGMTRSRHRAVAEGAKPRADEVVRRVDSTRGVGIGARHKSPPQRTHTQRPTNSTASPSTPANGGQASACPTPSHSYDLTSKRKIARRWIGWSRRSSRSLGTGSRIDERVRRHSAHAPHALSSAARSAPLMFPSGTRSSPGKPGAGPHALRICARSDASTKPF